jgi:hypothetical protein
MALKETPPTIEEALAEIRTKPVVKVWPTVGVVLGLSRGGTCSAVKDGTIDTIPIGKKLRKAITAPLRQKLGIG